MIIEGSAQVTKWLKQTSCWFYSRLQAEIGVWKEYKDKIQICDNTNVVQCTTISGKFYAISIAWQVKAL